MQQAWAPNADGVARMIDAALILCADHELNASSFTARCVASTGATPYAAVIAALSALQGYKHGGATREVAMFLREAGTDPIGATQRRLRHGLRLPGFGHPLYEQGDPRGKMLLTLALRYCGDASTLACAEQIVLVARQAMQLEPNIDFGLAVLAQGAALPSYAPFGLFALGRTAGWIGHIIEEYGHDRLIRPRARYVGVQSISTMFN
ncbi:MAG: citrate/2-methylcitrate synthase [Caldilineaceae bacterium]